MTLFRRTAVDDLFNGPYAREIGCMRISGTKERPRTTGSEAD